MTIRLVLAGCGNMGYAMLAGWLKSGKLVPQAVFVVEPNAELRKRAEHLGCGVAEDANGIPADAEPDLVVIAVKPQVIRDVTTAYKRFADGRTTFVSIAAGTPVATFEHILGHLAPIIRCMPNTPAAIGKGMMVVLFTALNAFLESFFFHRGDPVWLFFVLGVLGLRQVSLRPIAVRRHS